MVLRHRIPQNLTTANTKKDLQSVEHSDRQVLFSLLFMVFATEFAVSETTLETVFFKRLSKKPI